MAYKNTAVQTARSDGLLLMLYNGLVQSLERAKEAIERRDISEAHVNIIKAQDIVREGLLEPLDFSYEVSNSLASLYEYFIRRLIEANMKKDADVVQEVLTLVTELRDTWSQAAITANTSQSLTLESTGSVIG